MKTINIEALQRRVTPTDLTPSWRALQARIGDSYIWSVFSKYAAYCSALGIDVDKADEAVAADFDLAFRAAGKTYGQQHIESMRRYSARLRAKDPAIVCPPLNPPRVRATPRQDQWEALLDPLRDDIVAYIDRCMPGVNDQAKLARQNFLMRNIALAQSLGFAIDRLADLFDVPVLRALEKAAFGVPSLANWRNSATAIFYRARLLEIGRKYAFKVLDDEPMGERLDGYLQHDVKRRGTLATATRLGAQQFDDPAFVERLKAVSGARIDVFARGDDPHYALERAQIGLAIFLILITGRPPRKIIHAAFTGPLRRLVGSGRLSRPALALPDCGVEDVEADLSEETLACFDRFWKAFFLAVGDEPTQVFVDRKGKLKTTFALAVGVGKLGAEIGVRLTPQIVQVAVARLLIKSGLPDEDIARILGLSQEVNLRARYEPIFNEGASQSFADDLMRRSDDDDDHDVDDDVKE
jgi:hypothetical protein